MKYIDSNIIAYAFYDNKYNEICQNVLRDGGLTNTFNLIEAFNIIEHETSRENAIIAMKAILKLNIKILSVDNILMYEVIKSSRKNVLSIFDLTHYISAKINNCESIISFDKDFDNLDIIREEPF